MDHGSMMKRIDEMCGEYPFLSLTSLGESILGRSIPLLSVGEGEKTVIYVGTHRGDEQMIAEVLIRFAEDLCKLFHVGGRLFGIDIKTLLSIRSICVVPMLNPDGVEYNQNGISEENPLCERVISMNGKSDDLSRWFSNARGVDLNKNYLCDKDLRDSSSLKKGFVCCEGGMGEWKESEPEVGALCNYLRYNENIKLGISLHTSEKRDFLYMNKNLDLFNRLSSKAGSLFKFPIASDLSDSEASYGLSDWCCYEREMPSVSVMMDDRGRDSYFIYNKIKSALFNLPLVV